MMEDFRMRTISSKSEDGRIEVSRTRTTKKHSSINISIRANVDDISIKPMSITFSSDRFGAEYEQVAIEAARMLEEIAENRCEL